MRERPLDTPGYHVLLLGIAVLVMAPLAVLTGTYANFKLGFFDSGAILAGVLGSSIVIWYGKQAFHGANYIQTLASGAGSLAAMSAIVQLFYWLGLGRPNYLLLTLFCMSVAMFGMGLGMRTTPLLVDKWKLPFPGARAVAQALRTLADSTLLRKSLFKMGGGTSVGFLSEGGYLAFPGSWGFESAGLGAGLLVGFRIVMPAMTLALLGYLLTPFLRELGWLSADHPFFRWGFYPALAMILGASAVQMAPGIMQSLKRFKQEKPGDEVAPSQQSSSLTLWWIVAWGALMLLLGWRGFGVNPLFILLAAALVAVFNLSNGISVGIANANPISSAFAVTVLILMLFGVDKALDGLIAGFIVFVGVANGTDMQTDRATGAILGSDRNVQWWYNSVGILVGAPLAVFLAFTFVDHYPELMSMPGKGAQWSSAMTVKMNGMLQSITTGYKSHQLLGLGIGFVLGIFLSLVRKRLRRVRVDGGKPCFHTNSKLDFLLDTVVVPSPAAMAFGGFLPLTYVIWYTLGGAFSALHAWVHAGEEGAAEEASGVDAPSLFGGGILVGGGLGSLSHIIRSLL